MKNLISYPKHALSTILVFFVFLMMAEAQIIADFSQLRRTEGLIMQRVVDNDNTQVRKGMMNFHADTLADAEDFDYIYFRAAAESDTVVGNNMIFTNRGLLMVGTETDDCGRLSDTKFNVESTDSSIKLYVNGSIAVSDGNATSYMVSDARFKKNIKPLGNSLEVIRNSNFVEYQYNDLSGISPNKRYYGVLAQEMKKVLPSTVMKARKKFRANDKQSSDFYMFNPNDLIYSGLNAIKELDKKNQVLEGKIEEEVTKNEALEKRVSELEKIVQALIKVEREDVEVSTSKNVNPTSSTRLLQNTPNPLHQSTDIEYYLPDNISTAQIIIQDLNGKTITQFDIQNSNSGKVNFNAKQYGINSGTYIYSLVVNETSIESKKMIFIE